MRGVAAAPQPHGCTTRRLQPVFNLQGGELIIIGVLALVVLGPEKLPDAARRIGKAYAELRRMSNGFVDEFRQAVDEPVAELRRQTEDVATSMSSGLDDLTSGIQNSDTSSAEVVPEESAEDLQ